MNILRSAKDLWEKYNFILTRSQKRWGIVVIIMTFIGAGFETLGVSIILPLVQVIMSPHALWNNQYFVYIADFFKISTYEQQIWLVGVAVIGVYLIKNGFLTLLSYVRAKYSCKIQRELSVEMMKSYLGRGYSFFLKINTSEILRGMNNGIQNTYDALYQFFRIMSELMTVCCICIYIMVMDAVMALCVIMLAFICLLAVLFGFKKWMKVCGEQEYIFGAAINKTLLQAFQGVKEVLVMGKQKYFVEEYEKKYIKRQYPAVGRVVAVESPAFLIEATCVTGLIFAVIVKAMGGGDTSQLVAQLASFAVGAFRILPSLGRVSSSFNQMVFDMPGVHDTYNNFIEVRNYENNKKCSVLEEKEAHISFERELNIHNIEWSYSNSGEHVLDGLNMTIKKGQSVAFIGQSGAGKTTLADVILGLLHPQKGDVLLDNHTDIFTIPTNWSRMIGFVPQAVYLTDDTIRNNVGFGMDPDDINDEIVWKALEQAQLKDIVDDLPDGINTLIGERGVRFSGGQRQRIAIARALYSNPDILVLDEATSALDNDTESAVMEAIEQLQGHKTLIIIAHRLTTVRNCDIIYEIRNGKAEVVDKKELFKN